MQAVCRFTVPADLRVQVATLNVSQAHVFVNGVASMRLDSNVTSGRARVAFASSAALSDAALAYRIEVLAAITSTVPRNFNSSLLPPLHPTLSVTVQLDTSFVLSGWVCSSLPNTTAWNASSALLLATSVGLSNSFSAATMVAPVPLSDTSHASSFWVQDATAVRCRLDISFVETQLSREIAQPLVRSSKAETTGLMCIYPRILQC
jgi:hypothetical protein